MMSCGGGGSSAARLASGDTLNKIPADAVSVMSFNPQKLLDKADWESVKKMEFFQDALKEAKQDSDFAAQVMQNPQESGINLSSNVYVFSKVQGDDILNSVTGITMTLADKAKFEKMLKSGAKEGFEKKDGYTQLSNSEGVIAWNDEMAFMGMTTNGKRASDEVVASVFAGKGENMSSNKELTKLLGGSHDMISWANFDQYAKMVPADVKMQLAAFGIDEKDLIGNKANGYVDFNKGAIKSKGNYDLKPNLSKNLNIFFKESTSADFAKYVPGENLTSYMTFAMDIKGTKKFLEDNGMLGLANMGLMSAGITVDDLAASFGGDIMVATTLGADGKTPEMVFATDIKDKKVINKFLEMGRQMGGLKAEGDNLYSLPNTKGMMEEMVKEFSREMDTDLNINLQTEDSKMLVSDNMIVIGSNAATMAQIQKGGIAKSSRINNKVEKNVSDNIFGFYFNAEAIQNLSDVFKNINITNIEMNSDKKESNFNLNFSDKNENALKSIIKMINEAYKKDKAEEGKLSLN